MPNEGAYGGYQNSAYGVAVETGTAIITPKMGEYDTLEIYGGNTGVVVENIWGRNIQITYEMYLKYLTYGYSPVWDNDTYLLVPFDPDDEARPNGGNVQGLDGEVETIQIYRHKNLSTDLFNDRTLLATLDVKDKKQTSYKDYGAGLDNSWKYTLFLNSMLKSSSPFISNGIVAKYSGFYLIDVDRNKSYKIDVNVEDGGNTLNTTYTKYDTNTPFPVYSLGNAKYMSASLKGILLADPTDIYSNTLEYVKEFRDFIFSPREKIFKTKKGEAWKVFVSDYNESVLETGIKGQPYLSSFTITQIGEVA